MDKSGANKAAVDGINKDRENPVEVRQCKYLNNIAAQGENKASFADQFYALAA